MNIILVEVDVVLNSRPITPNSDDVDDLDALTPNHLLLQRRVDMYPPGVFDDDDIYRRQWRQVQALNNKVWNTGVRTHIAIISKVKATKTEYEGWRFIVIGGR